MLLFCTIIIIIIFSGFGDDDKQKKGGNKGQAVKNQEGGYCILLGTDKAGFEGKELA